MKIGLLLDPYGEKSPGGLGRAIFEMAKGVVESDVPDREYVVYTKRGSATPSFKGIGWKHIVLGVKYLWLSAGSLDRSLNAYIFFTPIIPLLFFPKRSIVVVHDFAYLELGGGSLRQRLASLFLKAVHAVSLKKATAVVAVSRAAKESTIEHFRIAPEKITVIYNGYIGLDTAPEKMEVPQKFFLFAGVLKRRKNVLGVIEAFGEFSKSHGAYQLLIAGKKGGEYFNECETVVRELGLEASVQFLGYVTDGQLAYLYDHAEALVFPSFIEGFGMPVLEAMHRRLPVITSHSGALAEVAGNAAFLVDPYNPSNIARAMAALADNAPLRAEYKEKGLARAAEFSWHKNAQEFNTLIARVTR